MGFFSPNPAWRCQGLYVELSVHKACVLPHSTHGTFSADKIEKKLFKLYWIFNICKTKALWTGSISLTQIISITCSAKVVQKGQKEGGEHTLVGKCFPTSLVINLVFLSFLDSPWVVGLNLCISLPMPTYSWGGVTVGRGCYWFEKFYGPHP